MWMLTGLLGLTGCGAASNTNDAGTDAGVEPDAGVADCFVGTATTNAQLLNACTDVSVEKILKETTWRAAGTTLPQLP